MQKNNRVTEERKWKKWEAEKMAYVFDSQKWGCILTIIVSYQSKARILLHGAPNSLCILKYSFLNILINLMLVVFAFCLGFYLAHNESEVWKQGN
jgi:hypothetical protein